MSAGNSRRPLEKTQAIGGVAAAMGLYVLSYVMLSSHGAYAPASVGLRGIKSYSWAPWGFYDEVAHHWRLTFLGVYAPLAMLDDRLWHTHGHMLESGDPVFAD